MKQISNLSTFTLTFFLLLLFIPFGKINAADTPSQSCVIQGTVRDKTTKQPVANATVRLHSYTIKTATTDKNGFFIFNEVPRFLYQIEASSPDIYYPSIIIDASSQNTVNVILETKPGGKLTGTVTDEQNNPIPDANVNYAQNNNGDLYVIDLQNNQHTNGKGEFSFSGLDMDSPIFSVGVNTPGFKPSSQFNLEFPAGQNVIKLTFQLSSTAVDTTRGTQNITVTGDVRDSSSKPIAGAQVSNGTNSGNTQYKVTLTDNKGLFILKDIPVEIKDNILQFKNLIFFSRASGFAPDWKQMASSQDTVLHFTLPDSHFVAGKIMDNDGNPIPQVIGHIIARPKLERPNSESWNYRLDQTFDSDSDGKFRVEDIPSENVFFNFFKPTYDSLNTTLPIDKDDIVITLIPPGQLSGLVIDDITGKPVNAFKVSIAPPKNQNASNSFNRNNPKAISFAPDDGKFILTNLMYLVQDGTVGTNILVYVDAEGYQREEIDMAQILAPPLKEKDRLIFRMKKILYTSGIVIEKNSGKPIPGVIVTARTPVNGSMSMGFLPFYDWGHKSYSDKMNSILRTTTDANGLFQFNNLPSKQGDIALEKQGYGRSFFSHLEYTHFIQLNLPKSGSITAVLGESAVLSKDSISGSLDQFNGITNIMYGGKTMNREEKIIYTDLPPGEFHLFIQRNGTGINHKIPLLEGQNFVLDLSNTTYIKVYGTVRSKGSSVENVSISASLLDSTTAIRSGGRSDKNGKYEILLSTPGKYGIDFNKWDMQSLSQPQTIHKTLSVVSGVYQLDANMPDSSIKGLLMNPKTGKPIPKVPVSAYQKKRAEDIRNNATHMEYSNPIWYLFKTVTTDDNGLFFMENMEAGEWLVAEEIEPGNACAGKPFQLTVNQTKDNLVFMLPEIGSLEVSVLDEESGKPVTPVELACKDSTGYVYQSVLVKSTTLFNPYLIPNKIAIDSTGKAYFTSLPVGTYTLYARTDEHPTGKVDVEILPDKQTKVVLKLKNSGRLIFPLKEKIANNEMVYCNCKILIAKNGKPVMQDTAGTYKRTIFMINTITNDTCHSIPLPLGDYTVELQTTFYSPKKSSAFRNPTIQTKLLKVEDSKDTVWEISLENLKK